MLAKKEREKKKIKYNGCRDFLLCSHKSCKEAISPGSQSAFSSPRGVWWGWGQCSHRNLPQQAQRDTSLWIWLCGWRVEAWGGGRGALSHRDEEGSPPNCFHRGWTKEKENPLERSALNSYVIRIQKEFMSSWYKKQNKKHTSEDGG